MGCGGRGCGGREWGVRGGVWREGWGEMWRGVVCCGL